MNLTELTQVPKSTRYNQQTLLKFTISGEDIVWKNATNIAEWVVNDNQFLTTQTRGY